MIFTLVLLGVGALVGLSVTIAPNTVLGVARSNLKAFMRVPPDDAALVVLLRIIGLGSALVFGAVFLLMATLGT